VIPVFGGSYSTRCLNGCTSKVARLFGTSHVVIALAGWLKESVQSAKPGLLFTTALRAVQPFSFR
jgi:hypothetical protein